MGCGCVGKPQAQAPAQQSAGPRPFLATTEGDFVRSLSAAELKDKKRLLLYFNLLRRSKFEGQFEVTEEFRSIVRKKGVPPRYRWLAWRALSGCTKLPRPGFYERMVERPVDIKTVESIEKDLDRTFPSNEEFGEEQKKHLANMLRGYASIFPQVGYCQGMNFVAGFLLLASLSCGCTVQDAFCMFLQVMLKYRGNLLFCEGLPMLKLRTFQFRVLLERLFPEVHRHFERNLITPELYATKWLLTGFTQPLAFEDAARVWDVIMCDGLQFSVFAALASVKLLRPRLLGLDTDGIIELLALRSTTSPPSGGAVVQAALALRLPGSSKKDDGLSKLRISWEKESPEDAEQLARASRQLADEPTMSPLDWNALPADADSFQWLLFESDSEDEAESARNSAASASAATRRSTGGAFGSPTGGREVASTSPHHLVAAEARVALNMGTPPYAPSGSRTYDTCSTGSSPTREPGETAVDIMAQACVAGAAGRALRQWRPGGTDGVGGTSVAIGSCRHAGAAVFAKAMGGGVAASSSSLGETARMVPKTEPGPPCIDSAEEPSSRGKRPRSMLKCVSAGAATWHSGIQDASVSHGTVRVPEIGGPLPPLLHRDDSPPLPTARSGASSGTSSDSEPSCWTGFQQQTYDLDAREDTHGSVTGGQSAPSRPIASVSFSSTGTGSASSNASAGVRAGHQERLFTTSTRATPTSVAKLPALQGLAAVSSAASAREAAPDSAARGSSVSTTRPPSATGTRPSSARLPSWPRTVPAGHKDSIADGFTSGRPLSPESPKLHMPWAAPHSLSVASLRHGAASPPRSTWNAEAGTGSADVASCSRAATFSAATFGASPHLKPSSTSMLLPTKGATSSADLPAFTAWGSPRPKSAAASLVAARMAGSAPSLASAPSLLRAAANGTSVGTRDPMTTELGAATLPFGGHGRGVVKAR